MTTPVLDAPIRCWLRLRNVQPKKKWITPAAPKARKAKIGADERSARSWVAAEKMPSPTTATNRRVNVVR